MRYIKLIIYFILAVAVAVFAVNNKQLVEISLYPFPVNFSVAAFILFFGAFALGIILGGGLQSFRVFYWKRVANSARKREEKLESKISEIKNNKNISVWQSE